MAPQTANRTYGIPCINNNLAASGAEVGGDLSSDKQGPSYFYCYMLKIGNSHVMIQISSKKELCIAHKVRRSWFFCHKNDKPYLRAVLSSYIFFLFSRTIEKWHRCYGS
jgi:hypothetical protein